MTDDSDQGLRALAKRLGLDPNRAITFLSASDAAADVDAFVDGAGDVSAQDSVPPDVNPEDAFTDPEAAIQRSQELGLDGNFHQMEAPDGSEVFVPGDTHQEYLDAVDDANAQDQQVQAQDFTVDDTVRWTNPTQGGTAPAYGVVERVETEGEGLFQSEIDGDQSLSATPEDPAYLIEVYDETGDGWFPTGTMVGHRERSLSAWDPSDPLLDDADAVEAAGVITFEANAQALVDAADADGPLAGVIWGAGDHDLALGGEPTPVRVPPDTIPDTFERLTDDIQAGDVTIGFDHPDPDSVAAQTGIVDIGQATGVALSADERNIVLTDSELTNDQAVEAADDGAFDDLDWSVVADANVIRDENGQPKREDGRILMGAARIRRIDAVDEGAVDAASIERDRSALPDLKDETQMVQQAADAGLNQTDTDAVVSALQASATAIDDIQNMDGTNFDPDFDGDVPDDVQAQLNAAADIIDEQEQKLDAAQDRADAFEGVLQAHDVDPDDFDDPQAAAQALIDEQTTDVRQDIAELEAELAQFDTDDVDARASDLAGKTPSELQDILNARKATAFDVQQEQQNRGVAAAKSDQTGTASFAGGQGGDGDAEADDIALSAMDGKDRIEADAEGLSPADFVQQKYGLNAAEYQNADALHGDIMAEIQGDA